MSGPVSGPLSGPLSAAASATANGAGRARPVRGVPAPPTVGARLIDVAFVLALVALATAAAWPIYQTGYLFVTAAGAAAVGIGIALLGERVRMPWPTTLLTGAVAAAVLAVPFADPAALPWRGGDVVAGYPRVLAAGLLGWKQLITIQLPVGEYQQLLMPFYLVVLAAVAVGLSAAWRSRAPSLVAPIMLAPVAFAIAFGSSAVSEPLRVGGLIVPAPRETAAGVAAMVLAGALLRVRGSRARRAGRTVAATAATAATKAAAATRRAPATPATRATRSARLGSIRRGALSLAVAAVAVAVAVPLTATALQPGERQVLRTAIDPSVALRRYESPLADYRTHFTATGATQPLFTVTGDTADAPRLRLATLGFYDGTHFGVVDPSASDDPTTAFARVPQLVEPGRPAGAHSLTITVDGYRGVWAPTVPGLQRVSFAAGSAESLSDGFFYSATASAGVDLAGLARGDRYTVVASAPASVAPDTALAGLRKPQSAAGLVSAALIPKSLTAWVQAQRLGTDGSALAELISRLRARGYLSHFVLQNSDADAWLEANPGTAFASSLAGESVGRVARLFDELNEKQAAAPASATDAALVAAPGDDEQFSVAAALVAQYLGFPSRVVLGFALDPSATDPDSLAACDAGVCRGENLTAWVEVQGADGTWVPVNTTPQHANPPAQTIMNHRDPQNPTTTDPQDATEQQPPAANPSGSDQRSSSDHQPASPTRRWLPLARAAGGTLLVLLVLAAPLLAVLAVKHARRRERRRASSAAERIAGGWDELVDTAVDLGLPHPLNRTRSETVDGWLQPSTGSVGRPLPTPLAVLAEGADAAVFGDDDPSDAAAAQYWTLIDLELDRLAARQTPWRRLRARFSLRSFRRG